MGQAKDIGTADDEEDSYGDDSNKVIFESPSTKFGRISEKTETVVEKTSDGVEESVDMDYFARLSEDTI